MTETVVKLSQRVEKQGEPHPCVRRLTWELGEQASRQFESGVVLSLADRAARGAAATLGAQAIRFVIQLVSVSVLARLLTQSDYGLFAMVLAIAGVASVIGDFGLSMAAIQKQDLSQGQRSNLFWTNVAVGVICAFAVFFSAEPISDFYGYPELVVVTQVVAVTFLVNALTPQFRAEVSRRLRFRWLASADVAAQALGLIIAIGIAVAGGGYWALVAQQLGVAIVTLAVLVMGARWLPGLPRRRQQMRALYSFGINTLGVQLITYTTSNVDDVLIGRFWGASALGVYTRAFQIFKLPLQQIAAPMTRVALPILSRLQADPRYEAYIQRAQLILCYSFGGIFFVLAAVANPVIEILLGPNWDEAKPIFAVLAIGGVFQAIGYSYYWIFLSLSFTGLQLRWSIVGRFFMVAMMVGGVFLGPIWVAVGSSAGQILMWLLNTLFAIPKTGVMVRPLLKISARPLLIYSGMLALTAPMAWWLLVDWTPWLQLLVITLIIAVYLSLVYLLVPGARRDFGHLRDAVIRVRTRRAT